MTRKLILSAAFATVCAASQAQEMKEIFTQIPDSILPTLTHNDRRDCIDFIENGLESTVNNTLKGQSRLTMLTPTLAKLQLSEHANMQFCKLQTNAQDANDYIICMIHSIDAGMRNSVIRFYNKDWTLVGTTQFITIPKTEEFIPKPDSMDTTEYQNLINFAAHAFIYAKFTDENTLELNYTSSNNADKQYRETVLPYVKPTITMKWNKATHRFVKL